MFFFTHEIIQEITRWTIYKAINEKILPKKNKRYFLMMEEPFLKMKRPDFSWSSNSTLRDAIQTP